MKQELSQKEIDSLLNALHTGEINPKANEEEEKTRVREYDFRRPIKLSKEYMNTLNILFEKFAEISSDILSAQVRTNTAITLEAVEQISFDEFINSVPGITIMGIFHCVPLTGNQIIEINPQFGIQVVELMCGGTKSRDKKGVKKDKFTEIELGIMEDMVENLLKGFRSAWTEIMEIEPVLDDIETNPQQLQTMSPNEPVVRISFGVEIFDSKSSMHICIPYISFENIIDKLSIKSWFDMERSYDENKYREMITDGLVNAEVALTVEMGKTVITVDDFLHLETGDIVQLDIGTDKPMKMYIEDKVHYLVQPGIHNEKLAVQVLQYLEEDVEI
ncbi:MAG: fliM [Firmicutes bacterium]|nr:fliM [Bacillota bacterium]